MTPEDIGNRCRVCGAIASPDCWIEMTHVIPHTLDGTTVLATGTTIADQLAVVPLCVTHDGGCHPAYNAGALDLLPHLSLAEQAFAVGRVGIAEALRYISGRYARNEDT